MKNAHSDLTQQVHGTLTRDTRINLNQSEIDISTDSGYVTLSGTVPTVAAKRLAVRLSREIPGVKSVKDELRVAPVNLMGDLEISTHIRNSFIQERNIEEDHLTIETDSEGGVVLRGQVHSLVQRRMCEVLCWWVPGVTNVTNLIAVDPPDQDNDEELKDNLIVIMEKDFLVDPKKFRIDVHDGRVTLRGQVDSPLEKDAAEKDCWYTPGVADVVNQLTLS